MDRIMKKIFVNEDWPDEEWSSDDWAEKRIWKDKNKEKGRSAISPISLLCFADCIKSLFLEDSVKAVFL